MVNDYNIGGDGVYAKVNGLSKLSAERRLENDVSYGAQNVSALHHVLLESPEKGTRVQCVMIVSNDKCRQKVRFMCVGCGKGFHVNCFTAYQNIHLLVDRKDISQA
eukprot:IDg23120t1